MPQVAGAEEETNVRVAARIRPLLPRDTAQNCCSCVTVHPNVNQVVVGTRRAFTFDLVYETDASQLKVYDGCVSQLLEGCMQGYNATVLAYGQTGSGKTHTMGTGPAVGEGTDEEGIVPKVIRNSFQHIEMHKEHIDFKVSCCYLEIYNEDIRDLLQPGGSKGLIAIREAPAGGIKVSGIHAEVCRSAEEMFRCLSDGSVQRTTGATLMNEQSSRSHSIFTLILEQRNRLKCDLGDGCIEDYYVTAKFHLVDLAGSERAKRTGAVGSRFKESVSINSGLLALGNVISALGDPAKQGSHVPYRESKLTRLLQDSLGGNSRTVMIACVSCADIDFEETLNTLKYAHRARNIKNKPVINHDPKQAQLAAMQDEIEALREQLQRANGTNGCAPAAAIGQEEIIELAAKLEAAEQRAAELAERAEAQESEGGAFHRSLADLYTAVCNQLPAIWQGETGRPALGALCEALSQAQRLLLSEADSAEQCDVSQLPLPPYHLVQDRAPELTAAAELGNGLPLLSSTAPVLGEPNKLQSLTEMRKDSTILIRKYLEQISQLETDLGQFKRQNKELHNQLKEARDDLQKDEEIFEEKMKEMKELKERNAVLEEMMKEKLTSSSPQKETLKEGPSVFAIQLSDELDAQEEMARGEPEEEEAKPQDLEDTRASQQNLSEQLQSLEQHVLLKEELITELTRSEQEWGLARKQYQARMEQLQLELEDTQRQLDLVKVRLQESEKLEEQARQVNEEEKRRLERQVSEQVEALKRKQQEYARLKELRHNERKRVKDLEVEVTQMRQSQAELDRRLQAERRREAQQIQDLRRRLTREGQKVKDLEAKVVQKPSARVPSVGARKTSEREPREPREPRERRGYTSSECGERGTAGSSRWQHLEQQLDEHIKILEATQGLEEDLRKQEALQKKREQYKNYRRKIAAKDQAEQQEAAERLKLLESEALWLEQENDQAAASDCPTRSQQRCVAIKEEQTELQRNVQRKRSEGLSILHDIDERLEGLQDELDFRDARIAKAQQYLKSTAGTGPGSLDAELERIPAEDGKELLRRYCEKLVKLRQREKQHWQRLEAAEAQLAERAQQVKELQQVLRRQDSNATKAIAKVTKEYESRIRSLLRQLSAQQSMGGSGAGTDTAPPDEPSVTSGDAEVEQVRRDNQYYKAVNRELKRRLRSLLEQRGEADAEPAPVTPSRFVPSEEPHHKAIK